MGKVVVDISMSLDGFVTAPGADQERGLVANGPHHEIYLSDVRDSDPGKMRTILRQPVRDLTGEASGARDECQNGRALDLGEGPAQIGRTAVVTGANTGLGFETARILCADR